MKEIKNIIFDLGGVIYDLNHSLSHLAFENLGLPGIDKLFSHSGQSELFDQLEMGKISPYDFRNQIRKIGGKELSDFQIDHAFNALLIGFNHPGYFNFLLDLKLNYRTFLLSNNNAIHYEFIMNQLSSLGYENSLSKYFNHDYYSHLMGLRKPNADIFEAVLHLEKLDPEETLFIDDTIMHIHTAQNLGIRTYHKKQEEDLIGLVKKELNLIS